MRQVDNTTPVSAKSTYSQLDLASLLAQPLHAMVDAQTELSLSTIKFIRDFGIDPSGDGTTLRNVIISQDSSEVLRDDRGVPILDDNSQIQYATSQNILTLPLISLLNVPALQIKKFTIDLTIELISIQTISGEYIKDYQSGYDTWAAQGGSAGSYKSYAKGSSSETNSSPNQSIKYSLHIEAAISQPQGLTMLMDFLMRNKKETIKVSDTGFVKIPTTK